MLIAPAATSQRKVFLLRWLLNKVPRVMGMAAGPALNLLAMARPMATPVAA